MSCSLLSVRNVTKRYGQKVAVSDVSFEVFPGEIFGLLGANGAGKTTLLSALASLHPITAGDIYFQGVSIYKHLPLYRSIMGFCPQKPNFSGHLSVRECLVYAGRYFLMEHAAIIARVDELLHRFNLIDFADQSPTVLSGGYKQRLLIARALMPRPRVVILDEPTVALDSHVRRKLWTIIAALKADGVTVLLTTHYIEEAEALCDRVCFLNKGVVMLIDTPSNLIASYKKDNLDDVFVHLLQTGLDD